MMTISREIWFCLVPFSTSRSTSSSALIPPFFAKRAVLQELISINLFRESNLVMVMLRLSRLKSANYTQNIKIPAVSVAFSQGDSDSMKM